MNKHLNIELRIIVAILLVTFIGCVVGDILRMKSPPTYTTYVVIDKGQDYSYYKSRASQRNILILKNKTTGETKSLDVTIETHYNAKVGQDIIFQDSENNPFPYVGWWVLCVLAGAFICSILALTLMGIIFIVKGELE